MTNEQVPNLESMLGELMRDPARMAQMQSIITSLGMGGGSVSGETPDAPPQPAEAAAADTAGAAVEAPAPAMPALNLDPSMLASLSGLLPMLSGSSLGGGSAPKKTRPDHRTALLLALKPYLNDGRREMIDAIVNFGRLSEMLGKGKEE